MSHYLAADGSTKQVTPQDSIWQAAARGYGTIVNGSLVNWDKCDLQGGPTIASQHVIPRNGNPGIIRIGAVFQNGGVIRAQSFDELWADCIFELNNVTNAGKFMEIYNRAIKGEVTRRAWVDVNTRLEYSALANLKTFYTNVWMPWSLKNRLSHDSVCWLRRTPDTYEQWIAKYPADSGYFKIWESYYDKEIAPYVRQIEGKDRRSESIMPTSSLPRKDL